mmetsp:Transcript_38333/g.43769  ORF Transcript_38333/g.43769 Transcript_38333/m.43769 type:complete len:190 (+) Transcript_38333:161-730(+)
MMSGKMILSFYCNVLALIVVTTSQVVNSQNVTTQRITAKQFYEGVQNSTFDVIVDIRSKSEWETGHIEGATFLEDFNKGVSTPDDLAGCKECTIVVYCKSGGRADKAAQILVEAGFKTPIYNGLGVSQWEEAGYPLVKTPTLVAPCQKGEDDFSCAEREKIPSASTSISFQKMFSLLGAMTLLVVYLNY